ncbi:hypothetical protein D1007_60266 [Hordeum vulgare]|nr:hypothetical protein D1007_60266 [Hordeum vulgare]
MGPRYYPSPRTALMSHSNTVTLYPLRPAASAITSPSMPPPATSTRGFPFTGPGEDDDVGAVSMVAVAAGRIATTSLALVRALYFLGCRAERRTPVCAEYCSSWQKSVLAGEVAERSAMGMDPGGPIIELPRDW